MKKELIELKKILTKYIKDKNEFEQLKEVFNIVIRENYTDEKLYDYAGDEKDDEYDMAKNFALSNVILINEAKNIRGEHRKYSADIFAAKLAYNLVKRLNNCNDEDFYNKCLEKAKIYLLMEKAGFQDVLNENIFLKATEWELKETAHKLLNHTGERLSDTGKKVSGTVLNLVKPYGEVAKGQLEVVGTKAKGLINNGSKKLIKLLEKVSDKTAE